MADQSDQSDLAQSDLDFTQDTLKTKNRVQSVLSQQSVRLVQVTFCYRLLFCVF